MRASGGGRVEWSSVPGDVRGAVEAALGAGIDTAANQTGGFSPGVAARCRLSDGRRAFVKAVSADQNVQACRIHRREAEVTSLLPPDVPAPRLRHVVDDGHWVVLVFDEVDGRQPAEPWTWADLDVVVPAVVELGRRWDPTPVPQLQDAVARHRAVFDGWRRLAAGDGDLRRIAPWAAANVARLADVETGWEAAARGSALVHADIRADNVLVTPTGEVVFVDWPWACTGAAFLDTLFLLPSIGLGGGPTPGQVVDRFGLFADVPDDAVLAVAVALAGFFQRSALDPAPPGLPRVRAFQQAQADVAVAWVRSLLG